MSQSSESEVIAPDDKSGFRPADVLEKAEVDDEVYLEFEVEGHDGVYGVRADVANTSETEQDNGKTLITYYLEAHETSSCVYKMAAKLITDTESAYNSILDSVEIEWMGDGTPESHIYDVTHVEVTKESSESVLWIDEENHELSIGETTIALRGEDGRKIPIDHVSTMDGYVAFTEGDLHLTFEEVPHDE